tara:strand:- start:971 stop:1156 length:186 start_codon:yes stop_codon:yes gene_type:complete
MKWEKVWNWYKKANGEYVKFKVNAVKADDTLVDKTWIAVDTDHVTGGYLKAVKPKADKKGK